MKATDLISALEAAIPSDTGPVTWTVEDHTSAATGRQRVMLCGTYDAETRTAEGDYLTDEPWSHYGGDAILTAVLGDPMAVADAGMDQYEDRYGDDVVCQWVLIDCEDDDA